MRQVLKLYSQLLNVYIKVYINVHMLVKTAETIEIIIIIIF